MKTKKITISIIAGIAVVLLLIGGTASTSILILRMLSQQL